MRRQRTMMKITRAMVERGARAIYKHAEWGIPWKDITPSGRRRFRKVALDAIIAAIPTAIRVKTKPR
jgi:hypothetical protein